MGLGWGKSWAEAFCKEKGFFGSCPLHQSSCVRKIVMQDRRDQSIKHILHGEPSEGWVWRFGKLLKPLEKSVPEPLPESENQLKATNLGMLSQRKSYSIATVLESAGEKPCGSEKWRAGIQEIWVQFLVLLPTSRNTSSSSKANLCELWVCCRRRSKMLAECVS